MQSTGQTSTQALSLTLMQGSAITYAIPASLVNPLLGNGSIWCSARAGSKLTYSYQLVRWVSRRPLGHTLSRGGPCRGLAELSREPRPLPATSERAQLRIERVPERIAEQVEGEDRQADREAREEPHPRRRLREVHRRSAQHQPPRGRRFLHAEAEEGEGRLEQDGLAEEGR